MAYPARFFFKNIKIMTLERIEKLIAQRELTNSQRIEVKKAADEAGIEYHIRTNCQNSCYEKLLVKLYEYIASEKAERNVSKDGWRLKSATETFTWQGHIVSNANIKGLMVGAMPSIVVETFFEKAPKEEEAEDGQGGEI